MKYDRLESLDDVEEDPVTKLPKGVEGAGKYTFMKETLRRSRTAMRDDVAQFEAIDKTFDEKKPIFPEALRASFLLENAGPDDHERPQVLASEQYKYEHHKIQQTLGLQLDKKPQLQSRKNYAAEGEDEYYGEDDYGDEEEPGQLDLQSDGATACALAEDEDVNYQLQDICDQAGDDRDLREVLLECAALGMGAGRCPPQSRGSPSQSSNSKDSRADPNTVCFRCGGKGRIAKDSKNATDTITDATDTITYPAGIITDATDIISHATDMITYATDLIAYATDVITDATDIIMHATDIATDATDIDDPIETEVAQGYLQKASEYIREIQFTETFETGAGSLRPASHPRACLKTRLARGALGRGRGRQVAAAAARAGPEPRRPRAASDGRDLKRRPRGDEPRRPGILKQHYGPHRPAGEDYHDPDPLDHVPRQIIVEERGQKWIKSHDPPKSMLEIWEMPQENLPFCPRLRLHIWGNYKLLMKAEYLFFYIPTIIILGLVIPAFTTIYALEEAMCTTMVVKVTGRQWYWVYEVESPTDDGDDDE
ncbi:unnamed protein product [Prorocentrum cordatum]|uniref:Cytochrome oxidase subunit II copper A binding domain-containing protein n=1 Tax=Prorocentrum cordatum TaxID=2364126 RepID=A0ABN9Q4Z2_9DINO|nr:unnamed protein product [Polarella glacialis]